MQNIFWFSYGIHERMEFLLEQNYHHYEKITDLNIHAR